jgi:NAD(P)-dependent dehydrogenase (short-subunit alcohol dehydrogenase family)
MRFTVDIADKVVVVTGGASGIGAAMVRRFQAEGAAGLAVVDVDVAGAQAVATEVGGQAFHLDVADDRATRDVFAEINAKFTRIDILCLNAGIATGGSIDVANEVWEQTWQINVMSHIYALRCVLPGMLKRGNGYVVHTASAAGILTNIGAAPYSVTKHAVVALAEWLAVTYGDQGIGVSALCPQFVETPMLDAFAGDSGTTRSWVTDIAISPEEVAQAVVDGIRAERFLILPHPDVADYALNRATDHDRWIRGMQKLRASLEE